MPRLLTKTLKYQPLIYTDQSVKKQLKVYRPIAPVKLGFGNTLSKFFVDCLIDSGADVNLFPVDWGKSVGIHITKGEKHAITDISGSQIDVFSHRVNLWLSNDIQFSSVTYFSYQQEIPVLGRKGFFDFFEKISFYERDRIIILSYKKFSF